MRIDGLPQQPKVPETQQRNASTRVRKGGEKPADVVEISQSATEVSALVKAAPAEDMARVQEVRARIRSGHYDSRQVRERIAEALLTSDGIRQVVGEVVQVQAARRELEQIPDVRPGSVEQARQRMHSGFYDTPETRRQTADRILDELA